MTDEIFWYTKYVNISEVIRHCAQGAHNFGLCKFLSNEAAKHIHIYFGLSSN